MKNPLSTLKSLVQILNDGHEGFKKAAEDIKDTELKTLFSKFSLQRKKFAGELETELRSLGEKDPQNEGTTYAGTAHRVWIDLKAAVLGNDSHAVLAEAERGEDVAVQAYKDAIADENLTASLRSIITRQAAEVKATHDEVKKLRDAVAR
ncbi:MAG: PA2169 family four-helix-bundle protein [Candidatus Methylacidiphilales bacterium]|nr:PA2169 family four-helix-bundle protein [Candidatus Methylacidiphilales bacterium]